MPADPSALAPRHVGRVRIRARDRQDVYPASVLIADALNTASLPGAERERLVVIRRLALGRISLRRSAASVALRLEEAARQAVTEAVSFESAQAGDANAVVFADRAHALCALARTLASDGREDHWFWPMVVPGWNPAAPRRDRWVHLMNAAHDDVRAPLLAGAVLEEAMHADAGEELLSGLTPGAGARWLRLEGWTNIAPAPAARPWRPTSVRSADVIRRWAAAWGPADDRTIWLATLLTCIERPESIGHASLATRVASALARMPVPSLVTRRHEPEPAGHEPIAAGPHRDTARAQRGESWSQSDHAPDDALEPPALGETPGEGDGVSTGRQTESPTLHDRPSADRLDWPQPALSDDEGFFTHFAGIFFVVPVLERLQFASFLADHPELVDAAFPMRLLWFIARRAGLPATDPLARVFEDRCGATAETERSTEIEWLTAVRRWCRRRARIGLVTLIRRPGHLHLSRTHIEAAFPLSELDLRVRRSALDVDPGWVPWLGRVVQFTYGGRHDH